MTAPDTGRSEHPCNHDPAHVTTGRSDTGDGLAEVERDPDDVGCGYCGEPMESHYTGDAAYHLPCATKVYGDRFEIGPPRSSGVVVTGDGMALTEAEKSLVQIEVAALRAGHVHMRDVFAVVEHILADRSSGVVTREGLAEAWSKGWRAAQQVVDLDGVKCWAHTVFPEGYEGNPYVVTANQYEGGESRG